MNRAPFKILVAEYVPSLNRGELAILKGMMKSFETLGEIEVAIFSLHPQVDKYLYPPNIRTIDVANNLHLRSLLPQSKTNLLWASFLAFLQHLFFIFLYKLIGKNALKIMDKPLWRAYVEHDVFIICHDEVDCVNGVILKFSPLYISLLAKTLRKPVSIYANGTTPFTNEIWIGPVRIVRLWKILARLLLANVDLITVREQGTLVYYKELTRDKVPIYLTADPSFLMSSVEQDKIEKIMAVEKMDKSKRPLIGMAMTREVLCMSSKNELDPAVKYKNGVKGIAELLDRMTEELDSTIAFIPHSIEQHRFRDDRVVAKDIYNLMLNKHKVQVIVNEYSPEELKGIIGQLDLLISCRVHAAISALSMNVPTLIITRPWDRRAHNIIGKMLKQDRWIYNVENLDSDKLFRLTTDLLAASTEIRRYLPSRINHVKERALLNGRLLKALLDSSLN
jgi:colanic acid/amylovoran biosynthesis protein